VFGTNARDRPGRIPYLHPDPAKVSRCGAARSADTASLKVGVVWAGNPCTRATAYRSLAAGSMLRV